MVKIGPPWSLARVDGKLSWLEIKTEKNGTPNLIHGVESGLEHATPYEAGAEEKWCQVPDDVLLVTDKMCRDWVRVTAGGGPLVVRMRAKAGVEFLWGDEFLAYNCCWRHTSFLSGLYHIVKRQQGCDGFTPVTRPVLALAFRPGRRS